MESDKESKRAKEAARHRGLRAKKRNELAYLRKLKVFLIEKHIDILREFEDNELNMSMSPSTVQATPVQAIPIQATPLQATVLDAQLVLDFNTPSWPENATSQHLLATTTTLCCH